MTRVSRLAFGFVMIGGAIVLARNMLAQAHHHDWDAHVMVPWHAWQIIVGTWVFATVAGLLGMLVRDRGDRQRVASYVVPSVGMALMLPLTIHLPIVMKLSGVEGFDEWVMYSGIFVGIAHIAFAIMAGARARAIVEGREPFSVATIYGVTVAMACVPGLLVVLPPIITAATGVPILPLLYLMERWGKRDRLEAALPTAVVREVV